MLLHIVPLHAIDPVGAEPIFFTRYAVGTGSFFLLLKSTTVRRRPVLLPSMQALRVAQRPIPRLALRRLTTATSSASSSPSAHSSQPSLIIPLSNVEAQWENLSKADQATVHRQLEEIQKKDWKALSVDEKKAGGSFVLSFQGVDEVLSLMLVALSLLRRVRPTRSPNARLAAWSGSQDLFVDDGSRWRCGVDFVGRPFTRCVFVSLFLVPPIPDIDLNRLTRAAVAPPPPKTLTREWQEASNERAREQKLDPITGMSCLPPIVIPDSTWCATIAIGISSQGYSGKGFVEN